MQRLSGLLREVVVYKSLKTMENINHKAQKLVVVAYGRFDCIPMVKTIGSFRYHNGDDGESVT